VTPGAHPGIVVAHGSERGTRILYGIWVGLYASLGFTVLTYDKRGAGDSTGRWPGEFPSPQALAGRKSGRGDRVDLAQAGDPDCLKWHSDRPA
jgi:hypothetical protein